MQARSIELAENILKLLADEDFHDAISALKIAKIMLPTKVTNSPCRTRHGTPQVQQVSA